jgi:hypothetical protein
MSTSACVSVKKFQTVVTAEPGRHTPSPGLPGGLSSLQVGRVRGTVECALNHPTLTWQDMLIKAFGVWPGNG